MASILDDRASGSQEVPVDTHTTDENVKISQLRKEERLLEFSPGVSEKAQSVLK